MLKASQENPEFDLPEAEIQVRKADARELDFIEDGSVKLVCAHPPYANALKYTFFENKDLSNIEDIDMFCSEMSKVARELKRILSDDGICAVLIGDIRKSGRFIPLEHYIFEFLPAAAGEFRISIFGFLILHLLPVFSTQLSQLDLN